MNMSDLSATRKIVSISTVNGAYYVGDGHGYYEKITTTEKNGDQAWIIWYQLWASGQVVKEVNSRQVVDVDYEPIIDGDIPF